MINSIAVRQDFPILQRQINGKPLVYLDNAATSQKPKQVIEAISNFYAQHNANIHRGIHTLGDEATRLYQESREKIARFIGATDPNELVLVRNTTEALNLISFSWGEQQLQEGDIIITSELEHHSNIVPWQMLAERKKAHLHFVEVDEAGFIQLDHLNKLLEGRVKLIALNHISNFLGTIQPIEEIVQLVRSKRPETVIVLDGAQSVPHLPVEVSKLGVDFLAFSGHKMLGPMGIGGLWVKKEILAEIPPFLTGGGMIGEVTLSGTTFADLPDRFEAGTPNVAGAVGLAAAVDYLQAVGMDSIREHEKELTGYALQQLAQVEGLKLYGTEKLEQRSGVVSFTLEGVHAHDIAQILDRHVGVAVRSGHHCVMPMHTKLCLPATTRASFYLYNTKAEVDVLVEGLEKVREIFKVQ